MPSFKLNHPADTVTVPDGPAHCADPSATIGGAPGQ